MTHQYQPNKSEHRWL